jgi:TP901 family phage tail tape measure protein
MMNDLGLGIVVSMKDAFTQNATRIQSAMMSLDATVAKSSERMNRNLDRIQKGTMMVGAGAALLTIPSALVASTAATQKALGELASVGVEKMQAIENAAEGFTNRWAGSNKAEFITAAYDVKSALANLSDEAVGTFSAMAALTGKATKATTQEMVGTFTTAYGIFKPIMGELNDIEWAKAFSGALAQTVAAFKTNGPQMADAIKNVGATAAASNIPLAEQLAILGQLQTTMPGSEAGTLYKAFIMKAAEAGGELGLQFTDASGRLKGVIPILQEIQSRFPDLSQAATQVKIKKAFGSDEAVKFVLQMSAGMSALQGNIGSVEEAMLGGTATTERMANAMNQDIGARFALLRQQITNLTEILGQSLLPVVQPIVQAMSGLVLRLQKVARSIPGVTRVVLSFSMALGGILVVTGAVMAGVGMLGVMLPAIQAGFVALGAAAAGVGSVIAAWFLPVTAVIAGVVLAVILLRKAWTSNFAGVRDVVSGVWERVRLVFGGLRQLIGSLSGGVGQMSADMAQGLQKAGLLGFVVTVFKATFRLRELLTGLWESFSVAFRQIRTILEPVTSGLLGSFGSLSQALVAVAQAFGIATSAADAGTFRTVGRTLGTLLGIIAQLSAYIIRYTVIPLTWIIRTIASVVKAGVWFGGMITDVFSRTGDSIYRLSLPLRIIVSAFSVAGKTISSVWNIFMGNASVIDGLKAIGTAIAVFIAEPFAWARDMVKTFESFISSMIPNIGSVFSNAIAGFLSFIEATPLSGFISRFFSEAVALLSSNSLFEAGKRLLVTFGQGILAAVEYPLDALRQSLVKLRNLLPFSDAREGPLSALTDSGAALVKTFAQGIRDQLQLPAEIFSRIAGSLYQKASSVIAPKNLNEPSFGVVASGMLNLVPNILSGLIPAAMTSALLLNPIAAKAGPSSSAAPEAESIGAAPSLTISRSGSLVQDLRSGKKAQSSEGQQFVPISPLPSVNSSGSRFEDAEIRNLLAAILQSLGGLEGRPINVQVKTNIDGREVAEAVYKDIRERKIRNYETL